jgi:WD40 repeat protein
VRAIDVDGSKALIGLRDGTIFHLDLNSSNKTPIMESHSDGELWAVAPVDDHHIVTAADDNKIKVWNTSTRKCESTG